MNSSNYSYHDAINAQQAAVQKFDYFFLGIIVASLSFSVQTFSVKCSVAPLFIYVAWGLLIISFLSGFYRIERINMASYSDSICTGILNDIKIFENAFKDGKDVKASTENNIIKCSQIPDAITSLKEKYSRQKKYLARDNKRSEIAYQFEKWSFLLSMLFHIIFKIKNM